MTHSVTAVFLFTQFTKDLSFLMSLSQSGQWHKQNLFFSNVSLTILRRARSPRPLVHNPFWQMARNRIRRTSGAERMRPYKVDSKFKASPTSRQRMLWDTCTLYVRRIRTKLWTSVHISPTFASPPKTVPKAHSPAFYWGQYYSSVLPTDRDRATLCPGKTIPVLSFWRMLFWLSCHIYF